ncbi:response regulator transcription factor [Trinickia violacea]|uniref:Response regulator transcription factor n=1 Tax=Trinickia violacea TaxID=2571746 RepID=A0A4P8IPH1_9BURK|nr:response regulator transcription factor [Trinickia violacea]
MKSTSASPPVKVFLVEDSEMIRRRLRKLVGAIDGVLIVGEAEDSDTALDGIAEAAADIAIVDLHLARGSGLALLKKLAERASPVVSIVVTNNPRPEYKHECLAAGAQHFFDKSTELDLVRRTIRAIVEARG